MNTPKVTKPVRRGINIKLVLFLSILISLIVRQAFGAYPSRTVQFSLDSADEYRIEISMDENGKASHTLLKRRYLTAKERKHDQERIKFLPVEKDSADYVLSDLNAHIKLNEQQGADKQRYVTVTYRTEVIAKLSVSENGLTNTGFAKAPIAYAPNRLIYTTQEPEMNDRVFMNGRTGYALFGRSLDRLMNFDNYYHTAVTAGAKIKYLFNDDQHALLRRDSTTDTGPELTTKPFLSNLLADPKILEQLFPKLYAKLSLDRIRYIELVTPHALNPSWLKEFTKLASDHEHMHGISIRLIAEVDPDQNINVTEQLSKIQSEIAKEPYLVGFYLANSAEGSGLRETVERLKHKVRPSLQIYSEDKLTPSMNTEVYVSYMETAFVVAAKKISEKSQPEGLVRMLKSPIRPSGDPCAAVLGDATESFQ